MKQWTMIAAAALVAHLSCSKGVEPPEVDAYTLAPGNTWSYQATGSLSNIRILVPGTVISDTLEEWTVQTFCDGPDTLLDTVAVTRFRSADSDGFTGVLFYQTIGDTLFWYAYSGLTQTLPKRSPHYRFAGRSFASLAELGRTLTDGTEIGAAPADTLVYEIRPPKAFVFPLENGREWTFRERGYPLWLMHKKVTGAEAVNAGGTSYPCHVITWLWDFDDNGAWDTSVVQLDYVHSKGLIKRTTIMKDVIITTAENPDGAAVAEMTIDYVLTSTNVR